MGGEQLKTNGEENESIVEEHHQVTDKLTKSPINFNGTFSTINARECYLLNENHEGR